VLGWPPSLSRDSLLRRFEFDVSDAAAWSINRNVWASCPIGQRDLVMDDDLPTEHFAQASEEVIDRQSELIFAAAVAAHPRCQVDPILRDQCSDLVSVAQGTCLSWGTATRIPLL
jgi:hypothetical protein